MASLSLEPLRKLILRQMVMVKFFERDLKSELLCGVKRAILRKEAVPTIKKPKKQKPRDPSVLEQEQKKRRKEEVEKLLTETPPEPIRNPFRQKRSSKTKIIVGDPLRDPENSLPSQSDSVSLEDQPVEDEIDDCVAGNDVEKLRIKNKALNAKIAELELLVEKKNEKINLAKSEMVNITVALQELKDLENRNLNIRVNDVLKGFLTENQIKKILLTTEAVVWTDKEMLSALNLRLLGVEVFNYVSTQLRYPLPSVLELEQWVHDSYLQTGLLTPVFSILQAHAGMLSSRDRECVLLLGKTKANTKFTYDPARDQVIDNEGYLYCICVQGIFANWHQIVYLEFDLIYSGDLLMELITELFDIHYNVVAVSGVCDQETVELWSEFDISPERTFLPHPRTQQPVYMMTCALSTLSAFHKVLVCDGFCVQDDVPITKRILEQLFQGDHTELDINDEHLSFDVSTDERLTRELISHETARVLEILSEEGETAVAVLATLFTLIRDWYDLLTTDSCMEDVADNTLVAHQRYGECIDEQNIILDELSSLVETVKCNNELDNYLLESILVSTKSLRNLLIDLHRKHGIRSIATLPLTASDLNKTIVQFKEIHTHKPSSVNQILFQLSTAVTKSSSPSVTNSILQKALLQNGLKPTLRAEVCLDETIANVRENEAHSFLSKYVANYLHESYDYLGDQTFVIERKNNSYVVMPEMPTGSVEPSRLWLEQAKKLEAYISDIVFYKNEGVIENVVSSIAKRHPKMSTEIIRLYVEKRIIIRLNNLNKKLANVA